MFIGIILVCIFLFIFLIVPQIQDIFLENAKSKKLERRVDIIKQNTSFLSSLPPDTVNTDTQVALSALPVQKDYAGIIESIASAASMASVSVDDFTFGVGSLATPSARIASPTIQVKLHINGGFEGSKRFIQELSKSAPLSEISFVQTSASSSELTVVFFYRPLTSIRFSEDISLKPLSSSDQELLTTLSSWKKAQLPESAIPRGVGPNPFGDTTAAPITQVEEEASQAATIAPVPTTTP